MTGVQTCALPISQRGRNITVVVIIRAITLFSFIHSGFAGGCQFLQRAGPGGGVGEQMPSGAY